MRNSLKSTLFFYSLLIPIAYSATARAATPILVTSERREGLSDEFKRAVNVRMLEHPELQISYDTFTAPKSGPQLNAVLHHTGNAVLPTSVTIHDGNGLVLLIKQLSSPVADGVVDSLLQGHQKYHSDERVDAVIIPVTSGIDRDNDRDTKKLTDVLSRCLLTTQTHGLKPYSKDLIDIPKADLYITITLETEKEGTWDVNVKFLSQNRKPLQRLKLRTEEITPKFYASLAREVFEVLNQDATLESETIAALVRLPMATTQSEDDRLANAPTRIQTTLSDADRELVTNHNWLAINKQLSDWHQHRYSLLRTISDQNAVPIDVSRELIALSHRYVALWSAAVDAVPANPRDLMQLRNGVGAKTGIAPQNWQALISADEFEKEQEKFFLKHNEAFRTYLRKWKTVVSQNPREFSNYASHV